MTACPDPEASTRRLPLLLSRYAEALFWLARYMERVENLARVLDVTDTFVRHGVDQSGWRSVIQINADEERFAALYGHANAENVAQFYLARRENPNSILSSLFAARENARTLRPLIPIEMWSQINVFYNRVRQLSQDDCVPSRVSGLCVYLKEQCQTHAGIIDGTFYRDQGWAFYCIGKYAERGDQTSRLVDIKYHTLLPSVEDVGSALDVSQWHALLRAASGFQAYRRINPSHMTPASVAGFLLLNDSFPRSVTRCVRQIEIYLGQLSSSYGLRGAYSAQEQLDELRAALMDQTIEQILARGLHEFLDWVQLQFIGLQQAMAQSFWRKPEQVQSQGQSSHSD